MSGGIPGEQSLFTLIQMLSPRILFSDTIWYYVLLTLSLHAISTPVTDGWQGRGGLWWFQGHWHGPHRQVPGFKRRESGTIPTQCVGVEGEISH